MSGASMLSAALGLGMAAAPLRLGGMTAAAVAAAAAALCVGCVAAMSAARLSGGGSSDRESGNACCKYEAFHL
jgi:hypothetical protein